MITLITGMPGDGKTLYTIAMVKALAEKEHRPVYYSGIRGLTLPWIEFGEPSADKDRPWNTNPEKWYELPEGAIIVIDEAQRAFRPRANASAVPMHVSELETHRHKGHDVFLITQAPGLIDANARKLVGRHFHSKRKFGMQKSTVHEWSQVKERPDQQRTDSIRHDFNYPKALYGTYTSAEVHTHRVRIPMRFWILCTLPFLVLALAYFAGSRLWGSAHRSDAAAKTETVGPGGRVLRQEAVPPKAAGDGRPVVVSAADYVASYEPRISGLAYSAPHYDSLTSPVNVPFPSACVLMGKVCRCYTDQATKLDVPGALCRQIVKDGFYMEFTPKQIAQAAPERREALAPLEHHESAVVEAKPVVTVASVPKVEVPAVVSGEPLPAKPRGVWSATYVSK